MCAQEATLGRRYRAYGNSTSRRAVGPEASVVPAERFVVTLTSVESGEVAEETVKGMKRKLVEMVKKLNKLKAMISRLEGDVLYKTTQVKAISFPVILCRDNNMKLYDVN